MTSKDVRAQDTDKKAEEAEEIRDLEMADDATAEAVTGGAPPRNPDPQGITLNHSERILP